MVGGGGDKYKPRGGVGWGWGGEEGQTNQKTSFLDQGLLNPLICLQLPVVIWLCFLRFVIKVVGLDSTSCETKGGKSNFRKFKTPYIISWVYDQSLHNTQHSVWIFLQNMTIYTYPFNDRQKQTSRLRGCLQLLLFSNMCFWMGGDESLCLSGSTGILLSSCEWTRVSSCVYLLVGDWAIFRRLLGNILENY